MLESHGLFTWADDAKDCYLTTLETINTAADWLAARSAGKPAFGGVARPTLDPDARRAIAARLMPAIRGLISKDRHKVGHFDDSPAVLEFVGSAMLDRLAPMGTSCPDHFLRTKIRPLVVAFDPASPDVEATLASLGPAIEAYRADYAAYYDRCKHPDSLRCATPMRWSIWCPASA